MAKRLIEFLRSVLPADPYQLLFLAGIVCLTTVHGVKWWPASAHASRDRLAGSFGQFVLYAGIIFLLPTIFAEAAGYFICFWPGKHPIRRILSLVVFPVIVTVILTLVRMVYLAGPPSSLLQSAGVTTVSKLKWVRIVAFESLGLQVTLISLLLIGLFLLRLALEASSLPLTLSDARVDEPDDLSDWRRVLMLIWFLIALAALLDNILAGVFIFLVPASMGMPLFASVALNASSFCTFLIALLLAGPAARKTVRESIAVPKYKWTGFALFFPLVVDTLLSVAERNIDAIRNGSVGSNTTPRSFFIMFLLLLLPAFFEEALFRGLLQKRSIRRYGTFRGIFLVCILWAAFHFHSDFAYPHGSYRQIFDRLAGRILMSLCVGYVLSWLTLRSGTIVPATLCHAMYNALVVSPLGFVFKDMGLLRTTLWGLAALIFFRCWPVPTEPSPEPMTPEDVPPSGSSVSGGDPQPVSA